MAKKKGIIQTNVEEAFKKYDKGEMVDFIMGLINVADLGVHYQWQRNYLDHFISIEIRKRGLK